jgi:alpha-amylase/alpha-mannosidase (GH57 family)
MAGNVSIHGHFYQPPRKNPFTNKDTEDQYVVEMTKGKHRSWNEIILEECYRPNAEMGNFSLITFDLYRSLSEWLEENDPTTYRKIIESDNKVYQEHGFGSALGGSWDHAMLPLLPHEDMEIEIYWGNQDFLKRFGHSPVGFWLPETGVSRDVLDVLAQNGIRLVILAPWQVQHQVDTTKLYWTALKNGRRMSIAFYDKQLSDGLSFDNYTMADCDSFFKKYVESRGNANSFILGATDGERYGHHLKQGEKFLQYFLTQSVPNGHFNADTLVNAFAQSTPQDEVTIQDNTSWSCLCGDLKRWKQDCDCSVDYDRYNMRVNGEWKTHLFNAIHSLSEDLNQITDTYLSSLLKDVHMSKKEYIDVYLRNITESEFIDKHKARDLTNTEIKKVLQLLQMQIYRLASFTSCAWFFADVDRPEPRIAISNAKKALSTLREIDEFERMMKLEKAFVEKLALAKSNRSNKTAKDLYLEYQPLFD